MREGSQCRIDQGCFLEIQRFDFDLPIGSGRNLVSHILLQGGRLNDIPFKVDDRNLERRSLITCLARTARSEPSPLGYLILSCTRASGEFCFQPEQVIISTQELEVDRECRLRALQSTCCALVWLEEIGGLEASREELILTGSQSVNREVGLIIHLQQEIGECALPWYQTAFCLFMHQHFPEFLKFVRRFIVLWDAVFFQHKRANIDAHAKMSPNKRNAA